MTVNHEVKGNLARLLATEDLIVEHKKVETACFNVHTRVLTLPMWEKASNEVYDLLVAHEVGHALYTPDEDWTEKIKVPPQFVNIVEDVRVEKLMKRRYSGLNKSFYSGYSQLSDDDFFQINDDDVQEYNLADRVNLYFKIGNFIDIKFSDKEKEIVDSIGKSETFEDVLNAAKNLYNYCKEEEREETNIKVSGHEESYAPGIPGDGQKESSSNESDFNNDDEENSQTNNNQSQNQDNNSDSSNQMDQSGGNESDSQNSDKKESGEKEKSPEVKTMKSFEDAIKDLVNMNGPENIYVEMPKLDIDQVIIENSKVHKECEKYWKRQIEVTGDNDMFDFVDKKYQEFKNSAQKEVNYLVKEFECKKSADSYARATTSRTGVLDCNKLHTYKHNEDIFKKVTTLADGKNHGLIFILDWSGSMSNVILDTIKQLYNLIWFCKKVNIPFEVYSFTYEWDPVSYDEETGKAVIQKEYYDKKDGLLVVDSYFHLMNLFTSKTNSRELEKQMINMYRIAQYHDHSCHYGIRYGYPKNLGLSGTPLNESLIALHQILPKFQKENKLQKVQCVILTDGEAHLLKRHVEVKRHWESEKFIGCAFINNNTFLRDRELGTTYRLRDDYTSFTDILIKNLRDKFVNVNFIGIRILPSRDANYFIQRYVNDFAEKSKLMESWKKNKSFSIKNSGYHTYFGISSNSLNTDSSFNVDEAATVTQIKNAFSKSLKSKKMNKKVLGEFIDLVA